MSTVGEKLLLPARPQVGVGYQVDPTQVPETKSIIYSSFEAGLMLSASPESIPENAAVLALDMEVSTGGGIQRSPGLTLIEDATPHDLRYCFEQASLDYSTELVAVDPPYFGFKGGTVFTWVNAGISATGPYGWTATNVAGVLIFSNGVDKTYARLPGGGIVSDISAQVVARSLAVAFGRTFAGYYLSGASPQSLGLKWNAASGAYNDFSGLGSGAELLLADVGEADKIVGMITIGLDALAIFMRHSIWVGYPTGDYLRPADSRIRISGLGAVSRDTIKLTPGGATFLSDEGVANFNLTDAQIISSQINHELLPLDYTQLSKYTAAYLPLRQRYVLCTPFCTWIYEFPHTGRIGRWFKRSAIASNVLVWTEQSGGVYWDQAVGTWDAFLGNWNSVQQTQSDAQAQLYFILGTKLTRENRGTLLNLATPLIPSWRTPQGVKEKVTDQYTTHGYELEYSTTSPASVRVSATDKDGKPGPTTLKNLPVTGGILCRFIIWAVSTGMGVQAQITVVTGDPEITRIRQIVSYSGPTLVSL